MNYNLEYLNPKYILIQLFLWDTPENLLDVSYTLEDNILDLQLVYLVNTERDLDLESRLSNLLPDYRIQVEVIALTIEEFETAEAGWTPLKYHWKENLLYARATNYIE